MSKFLDSIVWRSRFRQLLALGVFALLAAVVLQSSAAGTSTKPYTAVFAASGSTVTLTLTNGSSNQQLGSANITIGKTAAGSYLPVTFATDGSAFAFSPTQASPSATASWDPSLTQTIDLRSLNLAPGGTVVFTMTNLNPCASGTYTWGIKAKQSNDFNGPPGNDFTPSSSTVLTTAITPHCALTWSGATEPASAFQGYIITGSMYASGPTVTVRLKDTSTGNTVTTVGGTVTLTPKDNTGCPKTTSFSNVTASLSGGFARFANLAGNDIATGCQLIASDATDGYISSDPSDPFNISYGTPCTDTGCPTSSGQLDSNSKLDASATGSSFMFLAFNSSSIPSTVTGPGGGCYGFQSVFGSSGVAFDEVDGGGNGIKTFRYYIDKKLVQKKFGNNSGQQFIPICAGGAQVKHNQDGTTTIQKCTGDQTDPPGWMGKQIDSAGNFIDGAYKPAVCDVGTGLWWGILASFQDYNSGVIDPSDTPNVTGWNSDTTYRWFDISVPSPWDWRAQG